MLIREIVQAPDGRFTITGEPEFRTDDFILAMYVVDQLYRADEQRGALERKPGVQNWIEHLPAAMRQAWEKSIIYRAAVHMANEKGMSVGHAIASAINWCNHICATGDVKQWPGPQNVRPSSRAECCAAVALWQRMKAAA